MTLTLGTPSTATTLDADFLCKDYQVIPLTTDKCVYVYTDTLTTGNTYARVVNVSGTGISSIGAAATILSGASEDQPRVAALSSSSFAVVFRDTVTFGALRAVACSVSGSTISVGSDVAVDGTAGTISTESDYNCGKVADNKLLVVYQDQNNSSFGTARAATVTGSSIGSFGAAHAFTSVACDYLGVDWFVDNGQYACVTYRADTPLQIHAQVLSVSGTTVTSGTEIELTSSTETRIQCEVVGMDDTHVLILWEQTSSSFSASGGRIVAVSRSGTTLTSGAIGSWGTASTGSAIQGGCTRLSSSVAVLIYYDGDEDAVEFSLSGTTITGSTPLELVSPGANKSLGVAFVGSNKVVVIYDTDQIAVATSSLIPVGNSLIIADMPYPCDVDADGTYLYISLLNNTTPILVQLATSLDADGTIVFDPAAGTNIGVKCSKKDSQTLFVAGEFDGTNTVEKSTDAGVSFSIIDDGAIGAVTGFAVGPNNDDTILISDENGDVYQSVDNGANWINQSSSGDIFISLDRLKTNPDETIGGTDSSPSNQVLFSPDTMRSSSEVLSTSGEIKGVIVG